MAQCKKCGKQIPDNAKFCDSCGQPTGAQQNNFNQNFNQPSQQPVPMFDPNEVNNGKVIAILAYIFPILFFLPLLQTPKTSYGMFHANQQLILLIAGFVGAAINIIPILGQIASFAIGVVTFVFAIMGIISAVQGTNKPLPIIGQFVILK